MKSHSVILPALTMTLSIIITNVTCSNHQWITRFHPIDSRFELMPSSSFFSSSDLASSFVEPSTTTTTTTTPSTTTMSTPVTYKSQKRRIPLRSSLIPMNERKHYPSRDVTVNRKKIYEYGNQYPPTSSGVNHVARKKLIYYKNQGTYGYMNVNPKDKNIPNSFIAYPILYHRSKNIPAKSPSDRPTTTTTTNGEEKFVQVGRVSVNPPEQIAPHNSRTVTAKGPKMTEKRIFGGNGRSASLLDMESTPLSPDRSLGNDMLFYPEPSTNEDFGPDSPDKNGISNDPNTEFVIIK